MITILYEPFSEQRREVRRCWEEQQLIPDWLDYLYLMTGRKEDKEGNLIRLEHLEVGSVFTLDKHTIEKTKSTNNWKCSNCIAYKTKKLCQSLPDCGNDGIYYRKLNSFEIRKLNKKLCKKTTITPSNNPKT